MCAPTAPPASRTPTKPLILLRWLKAARLRLGITRRRTPAHKLDLSTFTPPMQRDLLLDESAHGHAQQARQQHERHRSLPPWQGLL